MGKKVKNEVTGKSNMNAIFIMLLFWHTHLIPQNADGSAYLPLFPTCEYLLTHMDSSGGSPSGAQVDEVGLLNFVFYKSTLNFFM